MSEGKLGLRPLGRQIIVKLEIVRKTKGGILLPSDQQRLSTVAEVIRASKQAQEESDINDGDTIILDSQSNELKGDYVKTLFIKSEGSDITDATGSTNKTEYMYLLISTASVSMVVEDKESLELLEEEATSSK